MNSVFCDKPTKDDILNGHVCTNQLPLSCSIGKKCEQKIQYCQRDTNFCQNGGKCVDLESDYRYLVAKFILAQAVNSMHIKCE